MKKIILSLLTFCFLNAVDAQSAKKPDAQKAKVADKLNDKKAIWAPNFGIIMEGNNSNIIKTIVRGSIADLSGFKDGDTIKFVDAFHFFNDNMFGSDGGKIPGLLAQSNEPMVTISRKNNHAVLLQLANQMETEKPGTTSAGSTDANPFNNMSAVSNADLAKIREKANTDKTYGNTGSSGNTKPATSATSSSSGLDVLRKEIAFYIKGLEEKNKYLVLLIESTNRKNYYIQSSEIEPIRNEIFTTLNDYISLLKSYNSHRDVAALETLKKNFQKIKLPPRSNY
ncbi:MAG: hypothetical protein V4557_03515 [Bacteroidota bacterium]